MTSEGAKHKLARGLLYCLVSGLDGRLRKRIHLFSCSFSSIAGALFIHGPEPRGSRSRDD